MELYCGIDLHSTNSVVVVIDDADNVVFQGRFGNSLMPILAALEPLRDVLAGIVVESTYNWYWLVDGLKEAGFEVHLANPAAIHQYAGLKYRDDKSDARWLAHLLRLGLLAEGYIYPKAERGTRDLLRRRSQLVRQRTANLLSVQNQVARTTGATINGNQVKQLARRAGMDEIGALVGEADAALGIAANLSVMRCLDGEIGILEGIARKRLAPDGPFNALLTVGGIGDILGMTIRLETGDIGRFATPGNYASYCRCVDSKYLSNGRVKGEGNKRCGNKYLAWAFVEAAHMAIRYEPRAKAWYLRKKAKAKPVVARKAVAHKLSRGCFHVMRDGVPFDPERCFG